MPSYCQRCVLPETRPGVELDAYGICLGCRNAEKKREIDWGAREGAFGEVVSHARAEAQGRGQSYDCVIPISGGKDSYWQVVTCLERGLHPLCVTYVYPGRTRLGEENLRRLLALGVDHVEFRPNPKVERAFVEKAFRKTAISGLVTHMAIFSVPVQMAVAYRIPLVIYGENSAFEYGSEDESLTGARLDGHWLEKFGVTAGTTAADWVGGELSARDLAPFFAPSDAALAQSEIYVTFLGHYFPWDPENSLRVASKHGFQPRAEGPRVGHYDYVNIDDDMIGVHHHPKWHKFGITRSWDTLSMEIRNGRLSREAAIARLRETGDETPWEDIRLFCSYLGIPQPEYFEIVERFRNREIWSRRLGRWEIDGFLVEGFPWPEDPTLDEADG